MQLVLMMIYNFYVHNSMIKKLFEKKELFLIFEIL